MAPRVEQQLEHLLELRALQSTSNDPRMPSLLRTVEGWIGPTVGKSVVARALGITPSALTRWINSGDVPTVLTVSGRHEVPLQSALTVIEGARRPSGSRTRRMRRALAADAGSPLELPALSDAAHRDLGLAYHEVVAARIDGDVVGEARARLERWNDQGALDGHVVQRWRDLLAAPIAHIVVALTARDDDGHFLRQTSPFAGTLSRTIRERLVDLVQDAPQ